MTITNSGVVIPVGHITSVTDDLIPSTDGTLNVGSSANRWNTIYASNGTINTSDIRLKKNIENLSYGLKDILQINPISFNWKNDKLGLNKKLGFSAQELQSIIPEVVREGSDGTLGVFYSDLIPVAFNAIKELHQQQEAQNIAVQSNTLKTDQNITTLQELQTSIDKNLNIINQTLVAVNNKQKAMKSNISVNSEKIESNTETLTTLSKNIESLTDLTTELTDTVTDHERRIALLEETISKLQGTSYNNQDTNSNQNFNFQTSSLNNLAEALQNFSDNLTLIQEDPENPQPVFSLSGDLIVERLKAKKIEAEEIEVAGVSIKSNIDKDENGEEVDNSNLGKVVIPAGKKSVVVKNGIVKKDSYIMLTPNQPVAVGTTKIIPKKSFEVSLDEILDKDLIVNWFILKKGE